MNDNRSIFMLPFEYRKIERLIAKVNREKLKGEDLCAHCWHCHTTELKCISKTGLFCAVTHKPVHPMAGPCEHFKLNKYFAEKQAQKGRED